MAKVDPYDDSVFRYVIMRHQFDPKTNHFRWFYESAYDSKREYGKRLQEAFDELSSRRANGLAHDKEQLSGRRLESGYFANSNLRRNRRLLQGTYRPLNWRLRFLLKFSIVKYRLFRRNGR